ncbi:hypothetical protein [Isoptericola croceus]|uniref:hypothetical protein n=1 Tax=Isoptericola croceus TaxID=3031406 RepID=UPI0023F800C4|nr:hypothetical protein [Isoptericola croceus]
MNGDQAGGGPAREVNDAALAEFFAAATHTAQVARGELVDVTWMARVVGFAERFSVYVTSPAAQVAWTRRQAAVPASDSGRSTLDTALARLAAAAAVAAGGDQACDQVETGFTFTDERFVVRMDAFGGDAPAVVIAWAGEDPDGPPAA